MWLKLGGQLCFSVWLWIGTANGGGGVNHIEAQADLVMMRVEGMGCHAEYFGNGDAGWAELLPFQARTGWNLELQQTYPKLFHLFFLQARGVKIEVRLKHKFKDWGGGGGGDNTVWSSCHQKQTGHDWRCEDTRQLTSPHINLNFVFYGHTTTGGCFSCKKKKEVYSEIVVWRECLQGAVMHRSSDRLW